MQAKEITLLTDKYSLYGKFWFVDKKNPTVLLLCGLGFHTFEYELLANYLTHKGYNCFSFDFQGSGKSEGMRGSWNMKDLVDDTLSAIQYVSEKVNNNIYLFGNSLGAMAALSVSPRTNKIKGIIVSNCPAHIGDFLLSPSRSILFKIAKALSPFLSLKISVNLFYSYNQLINDPVWLEKIEDDNLITEARKLSLKAYTCLLEDWNGEEAIKKVHVPILVLLGKHDQLQPIEQSELLYEAANKPKKLSAIDTGHLPHLEKPEVIGKEIDDWIRGL